VTAAASPIGHVDEIRLIDFGAGGNGTGRSSPAAQLFGLTPAALATTDEALKQTIGVSLVDLIGLVRTGNSPPSGTGGAPAATPAPPSDGPAATE
jgi:uncharacterized membrane protein YqiK